MVKNIRCCCISGAASIFTSQKYTSFFGSNDWKNLLHFLGMCIFRDILWAYFGDVMYMYIYLSVYMYVCMYTCICDIYYTKIGWGILSMQILRSSSKCSTFRSSLAPTAVWNHYNRNVHWVISKHIWWHPGNNLWKQCLRCLIFPPRFLLRFRLPKCHFGVRLNPRIRDAWMSMPTWCPQIPYLCGLTWSAVQSYPRVGFGRN